MPDFFSFGGRGAPQANTSLTRCNVQLCCPLPELTITFLHFEHTVFFSLPTGVRKNGAKTSLVALCGNNKHCKWVFQQESRQLTRPRGRKKPKSTNPSGNGVDLSSKRLLQIFVKSPLLLWPLADLQLSFRRHTEYLTQVSPCPAHLFTF